MANIYTTISQLQSLEAASHLTPPQKQFVTHLLAGQEGEKGWRNLEELARIPTILELKNIQAELNQELNNTWYFSFRSPRINFTYKRNLKQILAVFKGVEKKAEALKTVAKEKKNVFKKYAKILDQISAQTHSDYQGEVILPISQGADLRLGQSGGECYGYVAEWARCLSQKQKPFGIDLKNPPPFKAIPYNSPAAHTYPELNHLAILTKKIAFFQSNQSEHELAFKENPKLYSSSYNNESYVTKRSEIRHQFFINPEVIANNLLNLSHKAPSKIFTISVSALRSGHALGFCKIDNHYHFFDSNFGWFRFQKAEDFKRWLPFYFKTLGYDKHYTNYTISSLHFSKEKENKSSLSFLEKAIAFTLFLPFMVTAILSVLAYAVLGHYAIKLCHVALDSYHWLKNLFTKKNPPNNNAATGNGGLELAKKIRDDFDLSQKEKVFCTHSKIALTLDDLSLGERRVLEMHVVEHPLTPELMDNAEEIKTGIKPQLNPLYRVFAACKKIKEEGDRFLSTPNELKVK